MEKKRPNIVLMVADDHGLETLGCYGNDVVETPHLDAVAGEGVRFENAFCTTASCAASRSVILTGIHNHTNGTYGHTHGNHHFHCFDDVVSLPKLMNDGGYRTGRVGKEHYAPKEVFPFQWGYPAAEFGRDDVKMSEACRPFIQEDGPFLLYWCSMNPHRAGVREDHPLKPNSFGNPDEAFPGDQERPYGEDEVDIPDFLSDTPEARAELAQYYQSISRLDRGVGRLMDILKEEGKYDDTVVIYVSDNGAAFPQAKTTLYEPGMNLPCIVKTPDKIGAGTTCDGLVTWADLTPTVLDFAGFLSESGNFFGRSFKGILGQESPADWRDEIYASHTFHGVTNYYPMRVLRTKKHKFIYNIAWKLDYSFASDLWAACTWQRALKDGVDTFGKRKVDAYVHRPRFELYDLENDPDELNNLAEDPEHRALAESFKDKLRAFQKETRDPWLHKWIYE